MYIRIYIYINIYVYIYASRAVSTITSLMHISDPFIRVTQPAKQLAARELACTNDCVRHRVQHGVKSSVYSRRVISAAATAHCNFEFECSLPRA